MGMPYNAAGHEGEQANATRRFAAHLADAIAPIPLYLWDERFTTGEAKLRMLDGVGAGGGAAEHSVDAVAAAVILEDFFGGEYASAECVACSARKRTPEVASITTTSP